MSTGSTKGIGFCVKGWIQQVQGIHSLGARASWLVLLFLLPDALSFHLPKASGQEVRFHPPWKLTHEHAGFLHVDRRHETPTSETKDCVTPTKAAGGVSTVPEGSSAPISTDVTGMAWDKQSHMSSFCITREELWAWGTCRVPASKKQVCSLSWRGHYLVSQAPSLANTTLRNQLE